MEPLERSLYCSTSAEQAFGQVADLLQRALNLDVVWRTPSDIFHAARREGANEPGILAARGELGAETMTVLFELVRAGADMRVSLVNMMQRLSGLSDKVRWRTTQEPESDEVSLWVEMQVRAAPMSLTRSNAFLSEVQKIDALAKSLQAELPAVRQDISLLKQYKPVAKFLDPVVAWDEDSGALIDVHAWAAETVDYLTAGLTVALAVPCAIVEQFALSALAWAGQQSGRSFGRFKLPAIPAPAVIELAGKAPGVLVLPAVTLNLGSNPYELGREVRALLQALAASQKAVLFTGTYQQLQAVFRGGQGGEHDPLSPVVRHCPEIPLEVLTRFAVRHFGAAGGGIPQAEAEKIQKNIMQVLETVPVSDRLRLLPFLVNREIGAWHRGDSFAGGSEFLANVQTLAETFSGLDQKRTPSRSPRVQERLTSALTDPDLLPFLQSELLGQDDALTELVSRLQMECLTRPAHQPIRYLAQGTPGTGKSKSAYLIAQRLGVPFINIDAASMPDHYTARSQLLGSARGIVDSHKSGRLEEAAKHHTGAVIEVSDLDHAVPAVRAALADLFLQVLETGEAQSAAGAMFSCANLIFAFTINLPNNLDESVRKVLGFQNTLSQREVRKRVEFEIKEMLSNAFLSRVGSPIMFEPLDEGALAAIVETAVRQALVSGCERLRLEVGQVQLAGGLGSDLMKAFDENILSSGARALLEKARAMSAAALMQVQERKPPPAGKTLVVQAVPGAAQLQLSFI